MVVSPPSGRGSRGSTNRSERSRELWSTQGWTWRQWLALGVCFGLGHGITERLLKLRSNDGPAGAQNFSVQPFPGQSLETLRRRHGGAVLPLRADLEAIEQDKRMAKQKAESEERRRELETQLRAEQQLGREEPSPALPEIKEPREAPAPAAASPSPSPASTPPAQGSPEPAAGPWLPPLPQAPPAPSPAAQP